MASIVANATRPEPAAASDRRLQPCNPPAPFPKLERMTIDHLARSDDGRVIALGGDHESSTNTIVGIELINPVCSTLGSKLVDVWGRGLKKN